MKAMILAAGEGTRLRPLTLTLPKPMVPIVGKPLLERTLSWLTEQGVTEAAINLYHRPQAISDFFGLEYQGMRLHYFFEETLRGTSGGVYGARKVLRDAPFYVIYGDNLIHADLRRLADFHASHTGQGTIGLFHHSNPTAAGIVAVDGAGRITRFVEKPPANQVFSDLANAGVYVLDPQVMEAIPGDVPSDFGKDIFPRLLAESTPLYGTLLGGYLQDTGTPVAYRQANWDMLAGLVGQRFENPDLWIDPSAQIGKNVTFAGRNIVGANVVVGDGSVLTDSILWENTIVAPSTHLQDTILAPNSVLPVHNHF